MAGASSEADSDDQLVGSLMTTIHSISRCLAYVLTATLCVACSGNTVDTDSNASNGGAGGADINRTTRGGNNEGTRSEITGGRSNAERTTDAGGTSAKPVSAAETSTARNQGGSSSKVSSNAPVTSNARGGSTAESSSGVGGTAANGTIASSTKAKGGAPSTTSSTSAQTSGDAKDIASTVGLGWNLGNSLDAVGGETKWGNPLVTPELIQAVADAGFELVRIPVTWSGHFAGGPEFVIDDTFMKRVEEVIGYVLDRGMYAIVNVHHDGAEGGDGEWLSILDASGKVTDAHTLEVKTQFVALWKQIATRFKNHGERLLFESMNEIHVGYGAPTTEYQAFVNTMNQSFVDTVRATGGNNATRCLVVPGYNTNIDHTLAGFKKPTDTAAGRLLLSVHYYDPWDFAGSGATHVWGNQSEGHDTWGQEDYVTAQFDKLKTRYVDAGLPVLVGEYGAVQQDGYESYRRYYVEYVTKAAHDRSMIPVIWDNGGAGTGADAFGLFDRKSYTELHPDVLEALFRAVTSDYALTDVAAP